MRLFDSDSSSEIQNVDTPDAKPTDTGDLHSGESSFATNGHSVPRPERDSANGAINGATNGVTNGTVRGDRHPTQSSTTSSSTSDEAADEATRETPAANAEAAEVELQTLDLDVGFWPVLKNLNFLTLWSGQVFSQLADKVYLVLMIALISSRFQASGQSISGWVSALMIVFTIPAVLFGFAAGVFVDRWSKKTVLVVTNLVRGLLVFILPLLIWLTSDWQPIGGIPIGFFMLLTVTFLVSTLTQFFAPAEQAAIPLLVEKKHLLSANSLYTTTMMASVIIGFALGEPVLELADTLAGWFSTHLDIGKEVFVGASYTLAGLLLLFIRPHGQTDQPEVKETHVLSDMREGLHYLSNHDKVRSALVQLVILFSVFAALAVLAVRMAELIPTLDSDQFGFLLAAAGAGMAVGAAVVGQFGQSYRRSHLSVVGSVGMALCLMLLSLVTQQLWPALVLIALLGGFASLVGIPMQTTIQAETPEEMRGKVFGLQNNAVNIALSLPLALAGIAETFFGLSTVLLGLSGVILAGGLLTWYSSRRGSRLSESQSS